MAVLRCSLMVATAVRYANDFSPTMEPSLSCARAHESALALRAVERRAAGLHEPLDSPAPAVGAPAVCRGANAAGARLAFAVVDPPMVLEPAELARGLHVVARRRAAGGDRARQHVLDRVGESRRALALDARRKAPRRYAGLEQS